jgi:hypothetical protein
MNEEMPRLGLLDDTLNGGPVKDLLRNIANLREQARRAAEEKDKAEKELLNQMGLLKQMGNLEIGKVYIVGGKAVRVKLRTVAERRDRATNQNLEVEVMDLAEKIEILLPLDPVPDPSYSRGQFVPSLGGDS